MILRLTDRISGQPILLQSADILAVWSAIEVVDGAPEMQVIGSNIFTYTGHGIGDPPRVPVTESVADIGDLLDTVRVLETEMKP